MSKTPKPNPYQHKSINIKHQNHVILKSIITNQKYHYKTESQTTTKPQNSPNFRTKNKPNQDKKNEPNPLKNQR